MGRENVETIRRAFDLWPTADLDEWTASFFHEDVVVVAPEGWPEGPLVRGREAWRQQTERLRDTWARAETPIDELEEVGEGRVFARLRYVTRGSDEAMSFETPMAVAFLLEDGRVRRAEFYWDAAKARKTAESGL